MIDTMTQLECENCESTELSFYSPHGEYSSMYECLDCEHVGSCDHEISTHTEIHEVDTMRNGEHDTYETTIVICDTCDSEVEQ